MDENSGDVVVVRAMGGADGSSSLMPPFAITLENLSGEPPNTPSGIWMEPSTVYTHSHTSTRAHPTRTRRPLWQHEHPTPFTPHPTPPTYKVSYNRRSQLLAIGAKDRSFCLYHVNLARQGGQPLVTKVTDVAGVCHPEEIAALCFSGDGRMLASASGTTIRLFAVGDRPPF